MAITLQDLKPSISKKKKKRIGRGNASGHGTYATRGSKGQKARSGVSGLKLLGMKRIILATPKLRGFKSIHQKSQTVKLEQLDACFETGQTVSRETLKKKGLIRRADLPVKILASGDLTKKLSVKECNVSAGAKEKIEKAGGRVE